jgi:tetratricopeptide (TPR) repeat protein
VPVTVLEDFTPYHESSLWRIHRAYYARRGPSVWEDNEVPYEGTSNYAFARQYADVIVALVRALEANGVPGGPAGEVHVLEVGCGPGLFAEHFLDAILDAGGAALAKRVRYVLTDFVEANVRAACQRPRLASAIESGQLVPATFDLSRPEPPCTLDGRAVVERPVAIIANYVACVTPPRVVQGRVIEETDGRATRAWLDLCVRLSHAPRRSAREAEAASTEPPAAPTLDDLIAAAAHDPDGIGVLAECRIEHEWRNVVVTGPDPAGEAEVEVAIMAHLLTATQPVTVCYPRTFLAFASRLADPQAAWGLAPGGAILLGDYTLPELGTRPADSTPDTRVYGDSLNHGLQLAVLDAFAAQRHWDLVRTDETYRAIHHALLSPNRLPTEVRAAFANAFAGREAGVDVIDFAAAARQTNEPAQAIRFFARALALDPRNPDLHYDMASACLRAGRPTRALEHLRRHANLAPDEPRERELQMAQAHQQLGQLNEALRLYQAAVARGPDAAAHAGLAAVYLQQGEPEKARAEVERALALDSDLPLAVELHQRLRRQARR